MFVFINTNKHHFPSCVLLEEYLCRAKKQNLLHVAAYWPWAAFGNAVSAPHACTLVSAGLQECQVLGRALALGLSWWLQRASSTEIQAPSFRGMSFTVVLRGK